VLTSGASSNTFTTAQITLITRSADITVALSATPMAITTASQIIGLALGAVVTAGAGGAIRGGASSANTALTPVTVVTSVTVGGAVAMEAVGAARTARTGGLIDEVMVSAGLALGGVGTGVAMSATRLAVSIADKVSGVTREAGVSAGAGVAMKRALGANATIQKVT